MDRNGSAHTHTHAHTHAHTPAVRELAASNSLSQVFLGKTPPLMKNSPPCFRRFENKGGVFHKLTQDVRKLICFVKFSTKISPENTVFSNENRITILENTKNSPAAGLVLP